MALLDDVIAVWEMNEAGGTDAAVDEVAASDLTANGTMDSVAGKIGNARQLQSASSEYFSIGSALVTSLPISMSCWFNPASSGNMNIAGGGIAGSNNFAWAFYKSPDDELGFYATDGSGNFDVIEGTTVLTVDGSTWYHAFIAWRSATDRQLYLNGASEGTSSVSRTLSGSADTFKIGTYPPTPSDYLNGSVDQTALWGADKTSDLAALYNSGNGLAYASWTAGGGGFIAFPRPRGLDGGFRSMTGGF
jgi:hypothetical protein